MTAIPLITSQTLLKAEFGGYSTAGHKPGNQDAFAARLPDSDPVTHFKGISACIADGASCSSNAQLASQTSVINFIEDYYSTPDSWQVKTAAARVFRSLNAWLYHHARHDSTPHDGLVTTFSAVILKSTTAHIFHVGDSRIYRFRQGTFEQLTQDHFHQRSGGKGFLTRALGMDSHLEMDYCQHSLATDDVLLLSTDGLHEWISNTEFKNVLSANTGSLEEQARALTDLALTNGSPDNVSCLLVKITALPQAGIDEIHRQLTDLSIPPVLSVGNTLDHYQVLRILHSGSRSHLYQVKNTQTGQLMVLKAPSANFADDPQYLEGFIREQWVGSQLSHPNLLALYPRPAHSPFLYHLCDHIEGTTLRQWMLDNPEPTLAQVRDITAGIISGLRALQRKAMVHRDLKPENVILTTDNQVVLLDFGTVQVAGMEEIASPLTEEIPVGALDYIAPEYLSGARGEAGSDLFSLAVMVYEMLTGQLPFKTSIARQQSQDYRLGDYRPARDIRGDIPAWVDLCLAKGCEQSPQQRYQAFSEFQADLTTPNPQLTRTLQQAPLITRNPLLFWKGLSLLLLVVIIVEWLMLA